MGKHKFWSKEEHEMLQKLLDGGMSVKGAALEIGRPYKSVSNRICRFRMRHAPKNPDWTEAEKDEIRKNPGVANYVIAKKIGRTRMAVAHMRRNLGPEYRLYAQKRRTFVAVMTDDMMVSSLDRE